MKTGAMIVNALVNSADSWLDRAEPTLIFATNHRTGSSALRNVLIQELGPSSVYPYGVRDKDTGESVFPYEKFLEAARESRYPIYYGHFAYGVHQHIPEDCVYFATVRDPVERVLSSYYALNPNPQSRPGLETWLEGLSDAKNGMVKRFCGFRYTNNRFSHDQDYIYDHFDHNQNKPMSADIEINDGHLKQALDVIDRHYGFIFLHNHFVENTVILQKILGTGPLFSPQHQNFSRLSSTPRRETCSEADQALIAENNRFDEILYSVCKEKYLAFLAGQDETVQEEIQIMKIVDQIVDDPGKQIADLETVTARLNATISGLEAANLAPVAVQVLARFSAKAMFSSAFSQGAIKKIQEIGTSDDVAKEVKKYRANFGDDEFISSLKIPTG